MTKRLAPSIRVVNDLRLSIAASNQRLVAAAAETRRQTTLGAEATREAARIAGERARSAAFFGWDSSWLLRQHADSGHPSSWRCRIAIAFYRLSHLVMRARDKVGCRGSR